MSTETDHDTGSESSPSSPRLKTIGYQLPLGLSPSRTGPPSSPESDLDVDSAPDDATPENLSLKKDNSPTPSITSHTPQGTPQPTHQSDNLGKYFLCENLSLKIS